MNRREFNQLSAMLPVFAMLPGCVGTGGAEIKEGENPMYGIIGQMIARPGKREELIAILMKGTEDMPGCLSYVVSKDLADDDSLWITEVWESREQHQASLSLDSVQQAIKRGRPLIASFGERFETIPVSRQGSTWSAT